MVIVQTRRAFLAAGIFFRPRVTYMGISFDVIRNGRSKRRYLHIHGDEPTARDVLRQHMKSRKGIAHLVVSDTRIVPIAGGKLDPNRMFSHEGADKNLRLLNKDWDETELTRAHAVLDRGRDRLLKALLPPRGGLLIAVHNNRGYSVNDELAISDAKSLPDAMNPHEFFLATDPSDFRLIATSPYNAVLQQHGPIDDDGSLSRLAAKRGVRYVNLECGLGQVNRQREMLDWLEARLP